MNVYTVAFLVRRGEIIRIKTGIALGTSEDDAHARAMASAIDAFPESDGWGDHQVLLSLVPNQMTMGSYLLEWQITQ